MLGVEHGQRPEGIVGWDPSRREVQDVVMLPIQRTTRAIHGRRPVHCLFRQVGSGDVLGACGSQKNVVAELATFQGDTLAIDSRLHGLDISVDEKTCRDKCQDCPRDYPLHQVRDDSSLTHEGL